MTEERFSVIGMKPSCLRGNIYLRANNYLLNVPITASSEFISGLNVATKSYNTEKCVTKRALSAPDSNSDSCFVVKRNTVNHGESIITYL